MASRLLALVVVLGALGVAPSASAAGWLPAFEVVASDVAMAPDGSAVFAWRDASGAHARVRAPGGALLPVQDLDGAGAVGIEVAVDPQGRAVFAWRNGDVVRTRLRLADGSLTAVQDLSGVAGNQDPEIAVGPGGDAAFAWRRLGPNRIFTRSRSATGELSSVAQLSAAGEDSTNVAVGVDADGDAVFAWQTDTGPRARLRSAAGVVSPAAPIVFDDATVSDPEIAVAADGDAVIGWRDGATNTFLARGLSAAGQLEPDTLTVAPPGSQNYDLGGTPDGFVRFSWGTQLPPSGLTPQTRTRSPDGTLSPIVDLKPAGENALSTFIAVGSGGDAVVAWDNQLDEDAAEAVALSRAGAASPLIAIANPGIDTTPRAAAVDPEGNAVFVASPDGPGAATRAVFWDPVPPRVDTLSVPATAERGVEVPLEVSGSDAGSGVTAAWAFGDGSSGSGASVTHAFERSGSYEVELTLGDAAANQTVATRTVVVGDTIRPRIERASIKPKRFRVGRGRTRISAKRGSAFRYTLSEPARVTIAIQRRKGRRWRRAGRALSRSSGEGANRVKFSGRIGRKKLKPGRYRARLVAVDPDGNRSSRRTVKFRIVRR